MNYTKIRESFPLKKTLFIMKTAFIALLASCFFPVHAENYAQETKLTINENSITLAKLFEQIESKTDFFFFYSNDKINANTTVSVHVEGKTIFDILDQALSGTGITYSVSDKAIVLSRSATVTAAQQQGRRVTGTVTDDKGEPVIGANVVEKGTTNGVVSDIEGKFILEVPNNAVLQISFIGYLTQEVSVANKTNVQVVLIEDTQGL